MSSLYFYKKKMVASLSKHIHNVCHWILQNTEKVFTNDFFLFMSVIFITSTLNNEKLVDYVCQKNTIKNFSIASKCFPKAHIISAVRNTCNESLRALAEFHSENIHHAKLQYLRQKALQMTWI